MSNIFEGLFTEEGTGAGKAIFKGGFKFAAYETSKKYDSTALAYPELQLECLIFKQLPKSCPVEDVKDWSWFPSINRNFPLILVFIGFDY